MKKEVEDLAKLVAKMRDEWECQRCGKTVSGRDAHGSHVVPVSHGDILRFDLQNIKCLCTRCHMHWWHKNPLEAAEWFTAAFPDRWEYIQSKKNKIAKFTIEDLEEKKQKLLKLKESLE